MSTASIEILERFRKLPLPERRELVQTMLQESRSNSSPSRRRSLDEVLGKYTPLPEPEVKDHNDWFAEAILASKRGVDEP
jgi:hypothetical protein